MFAELYLQYREYACTSGIINISPNTSVIFQVIYEQRERVFHRDIQTQENKVWKHEREARVLSYIVFECLDIPVRHELELFIWLLKLI
jgi:hypothetical protein